MTTTDVKQKAPRVKKSIHELRTTGFRKLKSGRIHLRCPDCGLKRSNMPQMEWDPPSAFLVETICDGECSNGCKDAQFRYFDASGEEYTNCDCNGIDACVRCEKGFMTPSPNVLTDPLR